MSRVLAIWLDAFDMGLADRWELPVLAALSERSATATLDHGGDELSGLSGEHLATGLDSRDAGRASAVWFDPQTYRCTQRGTEREPIYGGAPTVVFDPCYFDLDASLPAVSGLTDWGSHDPGAPRRARPDTLSDEIEARFGAYPARRWLYATPWASPQRCRQAGIDLTRAVRTRGEIATWLLAERLPDWELALIGVSEAHSASESQFHGIDPSPRWQQASSRHEAAEALRSVYTEIDGLVGSLVEAFPDAVHVVFSMHGMGPNSSDVPSMVLLGELLRRWSGGHTPDLAFPVDPATRLPILPPDTPWTEAVLSALAPSPRLRVRRQVDRAARRIRRTMRPPSAVENSLSWMPLMRHQPHWHEMRAFAIPSFYDGRVRVNVGGREAAGLVDPPGYAGALDELDELLADCRDPISGVPVVAHTERPFVDPFDAGPTDADLIVTWAPEVFGFVHPLLGTIGPIPPRRTGGHASPIGRCLVHGPGVEPGPIGTHSSFDVVPTLLSLSSSAARWQPTGRPMPVMGGA